MATARRSADKTLTQRLPFWRIIALLALERLMQTSIAALASFRHPEAIPILIGALDEDEVRQTAEAALFSFGLDARPFLLDAVDRFKFENDLSESRLRKYRSILSLLGETKLNPDDINLLRPFITNTDVQVSLLACRIALRSESKLARSEARARLDDLHERVPWLERLQIDQYLDSAND